MPEWYVAFLVLMCEHVVQKNLCYPYTVLLASLSPPSLIWSQISPNLGVMCETISEKQYFHIFGKKVLPFLRWLVTTPSHC
jgi:hypothetical protein